MTSKNNVNTRAHFDEFVSSILRSPDNIFVGRFAIVESQGRYHPVDRYSFTPSALEAQESLQRAIDVAMDYCVELDRRGEGMYTTTIHMSKGT
ncbi:hypothetical protein CMI37_30565 [Candidatus Pacearchaeota archaeon]|nr:hypothetical protein [Candidatus Pacearchaeota archaeon]|tara:strand:- start:3463 stop:3741 length:279 start_codon:yes stop_codon:yes gene_type:complete